MKVFARNGIAHISGDDISGSLPLGNLFDGDPYMPCRTDSGVSSTVLTVDMQAGSAGLAMVMTNISSCTCTIASGGTDTLAADVTFADDVELFSAAAIDRTPTIKNDRRHGNILISWDLVDQPCRATVTVASCGDTLSIGQMVGGHVLSVACMDYQFSEDRRYKHPPLILEGGVPYSFGEGVRRIFSGQAQLQRNEEYYPLMDLFEDREGAPLFFDLTGLDGDRWLVYGSPLLDLPGSAHVTSSRSVVNLKITEL